ncbi:MAG: T9SS type A sorting domain-containing protein [Bacteroidales bacterium]|nr:T9SS type A sorting domain-containing protein [Bacteroidales bacterium]
MRLCARLPLSVVLLFSCAATVLAQGTKYEAENGTLTGGLSVQTSVTGYSGTGYVGIFQNEGDAVTVTFSLAQEGWYRLFIGYAGPYGDKKNILGINGNSSEVSFPASATFTEVSFGRIWLREGSNTLSMTESWGWFLLDYFRIEPDNTPEVTVKLPYSLSTPSPHRETRRLWSYLMDSFTHNIHSGAMSLNAKEEAEWLFSQTGKYPALIGLDFMNHTRNYNWFDKSVVVSEARDWYDRNGLVAICWHWRDPSRATDEFYTSGTSFDVSKITEATSAEYQAMLSDIDIIAGYLKQLNNDKIPVLFRPLHEASGGWFWWGAKGPEPCKMLWRLMFDRLVNHHGLKNLIWVWTTDAGSGNLDWYPGDEYVDILGADIYASDGDFSSQVLTYNAIREKFGGRKLITLSENGPVPDPDRLVEDRAHWSWFMPWYGDFIRDGVINPLSHWQKVMTHDYVVTLDEMPDLKNYPLSDEPDYSGYSQGFFMAGWQPRTAVVPEYVDAQAMTDPVTVAITVDCSDTVTLVSPYLFGDNANLWTGPMSDNVTLMKNIANRDQGVMRGPGGSTSDAFFWNRGYNQRPPDVPQALMNDPSNTTWPWYGQRAENWTMHVDSFYSILSKAGVTGMLTVNYGYARYGTSDDPVAQAAHMAAEWVRYDNGRSKFWEIGNEVFGSWEAGYRIDRSLNKDDQPEYITPALYGQHCRVFIDSMRAAAAETGKEIKIGVVMVEAASTHSSWNTGVAAQVGDMADFYIVHSYYTPWNTDSDVETVLNSYKNTEGYKNYVWNTVAAAGMPQLPLALTEYNIFAVGSNQPVSHANGMQAVLATGEMIRTGYAAACRWDLANGWDNGNDHGMYSYNEPFIPNYTPHPAFFHLYYMRRHTGDVLLNSTVTGTPGVVITPTAFSSGHIGASLVNITKVRKVVRINLKNYGVGDRFYTYTLSGNEGEDFSRKVYVNGTGSSLEAGGPDNYESIKANGVAIGDQIVVSVPPLSAVYLLVEQGTRQLAINNEVTSVEITRADDEIVIWPNPSTGTVTVENLPSHVTRLEISHLNGAIQISKEIRSDGSAIAVNTGLPPGIYFISFYGNNYAVTKKIVIR